MVIPLIFVQFTYADQFLADFDGTLGGHEDGEIGESSFFDLVRRLFQGIGYFDEIRGDEA